MQQELASIPTQGAAPLIFDTTADRFRQDVVEASRQALILVDFWAEWCGPCKQLGPALERLVATYGGRVRLAKVDVDKNQMLAAQFRVQSIPMVYAFLDGQPVDGFAGALPDSQLKQFVDRLVQRVADPSGVDVAPVLAAAQEAMAATQPEDAAALFGQVLEVDPENITAIAGLARALLALGQAEDAQAVLDQAPAAKANDPQIAQVRAALELSAQAQPLDELEALAADVAATPTDHAKRFELANGLFAAGNAEAAVDHLLEIIQRDRAWNEGAARQQLLKIFEAVGLEDPFTIAARRRLSTILFS
jgi:putative thioredoxin